MPEHVEADVIIIGAGFSGCLALYQMRRRGLSARIIEANDGFGGVWYSNRYPGARVDSVLPFYQLTMPEVYKGFDFTERYPDSEALRGTTHKAYIPELPHLEAFRGQIIHPASWPSDLDLRDKRVGLIGQGASGIQILEQLAKAYHDVTLCIRTPCLAVPMRQERISAAETEAKKSEYDLLFSKAKYGKDTGYPYIPSTRLYEDETPEQHRNFFEERWTRGGLMATGGYKDITTNPRANSAMYELWREKARARMTDPCKMDIVAPMEQFQWIGGKRSALEQNYFEMIDKPNVKLINLKTTPIKKIVTSGIVVAAEGGVEALHELDILIFSTGYDSVTGGLYDLNITERNGETLEEKWKDGIQTYGGMMFPDVPNAFLLYGPQAPTALANGPTFIELQVEWIGQLLDDLDQRGDRTVETTREAAKGWADRAFSIWNSPKLRDQDSWWVGANIPGKKREPLIWFGGTKLWWEICTAGLADWAPFVSKP